MPDRPIRKQTDDRAGRSGKKRSYISKNIYIFMTLIVFVVTLGTAIISYMISADQIDNYFKRLAQNSASNFASLVDADSRYDMYLMDDGTNPCYQTGYFEEREPEFIGTPADDIEPTITNGVWGWLCSAYAPVIADDGEVVCYVGCDVDMETIMTERYRFCFYSVLCALGFTSLVLFGSMFFVRRIMVRPLDKLVVETKKFAPAKNVTYKQANVIDIEFRHKNEIEDLYQTIRSMQMDIIDYLSDISEIQKDNQKYIDDLKDKEKQIGRISKEAYRDPLTKVGNKAAYIQKSEELDKTIADGTAKFAIIMIDINNLKKVNDECGHKTGDSYIQGCCRIICNICKHSPVYRVGGDEFVVIMQGADYEKRCDLYENIEDAFFESYNDESKKQYERYSASAGMTEYTDGDKTVDFVFKRADKKMYENKMIFRLQNGSYRR